MKKKTLIVQLQWVKGKTVSYDGSGNMLNENGVTKVAYSTLEWKNYLKQLKSHGFCQVEPVKVFELVKGGLYAEYEEIDIPQYILDDVKDAMVGSKPVLTAEQKRIVELENDIAELKAAIKGTSDSTPDINEELEAARDKYLKVVGKKPSHLMKLENINKAIAEALKEA